MCIFAGDWQNNIADTGKYIDKEESEDDICITIRWTIWAVGKDRQELLQGRETARRRTRGEGVEHSWRRHASKEGEG